MISNMNILRLSHYYDGIDPVLKFVITYNKRTNENRSMSWKRTFFEEGEGSVKEDVLGRVLVGEKSDDSGSIEGNASSRRNLAAIASSKGRSEQVDRLRVGHFRVHVDIFVGAPI